MMRGRAIAAMAALASLTACMGSQTGKSLNAFDAKSFWNSDYSGEYNSDSFWYSGYSDEEIHKLHDAAPSPDGHIGGAAAPAHSDSGSSATAPSN